MIAAIALLAYVTAARLAEMLIARRNTRALMAVGAVEHSPGHYPLLLAMHVAWLAGLWWLGWNRPAHWLWAGVFIALQAVRVWVFVTLGPRWTSKILTVPGETLVTTGPYRWMRHPNYAVVVGEIASLPLALGLPWFALVFSLLNAVALFVRIRAEDRALAGLRHV